MSLEHLIDPPPASESAAAPKSDPVETNGADEREPEKTQPSSHQETEAPSITTAPDTQDVKQQELQQSQPGLRSWRKKYKKLKLRFEVSMNESNRLFKDEKSHLARCRRLQEDIDGLLDAVMACRTENLSPSNPSVETLLADSGGLDPTEPEISLTREQYLSKILATLPSTQYTVQDLLADDTIELTPSNYLDPVYEAEYLENLDPQLLESEVYEDFNSHPLRLPPSRILPSDRDLASQNQDSVVSWLKRNHPESFIQAHEKEREEHGGHHGGGKGASQHGAHTKEQASATTEAQGAGTSAKDASRSGNKRASTGKRGSTAVQQVKPEPEIYDEDSYYDVPESRPSKKGRMREDDQSYRPKGGGSKGKRKRPSEAGDDRGGVKGGKRVKSSTGTPVAAGPAGSVPS